MTGRPAGRRDLWLLLGGALLSTAGSSLTLLAVALHLRPLGPGWVAAAMGAELVPMVLGAPLAGRLVDRVRNRELLVAVLALQAAAVLFAATAGLVPGREVLLLAGLAALGAGAAVANPTVAALLPRISGEDGATRAYGWYAAVTQGGFLAGFAVSGLLVEAAGVRTALLVDGASFVLMAVTTLFLRAQRRPADEAGGRPRGSAWAGFGRLSADRLLLVAVGGLAAMILASIVVNVAEVFYVLEDLGAGPATYGLVTACWPLAGIAGGWLAGRLVGDRALLAGLALAGVAMGLALVLAGLLVSLVVLVLAWLVGGAANAAQRVCMNALVRSRTPDGDRGRTFAAVGAVLQASNLAGLAGGAAVVTLLGARASFLAAGAATVVVGGLTWVLARAALDPARVLTPTGSRAGPAGP